MSDQSGSPRRTAAQIWKEIMEAERRNDFEKARQLRLEVERIAIQEQEGRQSLREKGQGKERE